MQCVIMFQLNQRSVTLNAPRRLHSLAAAPAPPAPRQQPPHLPSARLPNPSQPSSRSQTLTLLQRPDPSRLPAVPPSHSPPRAPPRSPPRTLRWRLEWQRPPPLRRLRTGTRQPSHSRPEPQAVRRSGRRRRSGQRA